MTDDINLGQAVAVVGVGGVSVFLVIGASFWAMKAYRDGRLGRGWRWLRVRALGGVTTLQRTLSYNCVMCQYSLDAHEEVRTLSCNHVFHCRESAKCKNVIDKWLRQEMICPICRKTPLPVLPWKARPPLSPAPAPSGSAEPPLPVSSSVLEDPPLPLSSTGLEEPPPPLSSSPGLEDPLLPPSQ